MDIRYIPDFRPEIKYKYHPVFDTYILSSDGFIYSTKGQLFRNGMRRLHRPYLKMVGVPDKDGYFRITMRKSGVQLAPLVHRLVLEAFVGMCPEGMEGCHNDSNKQNNTINNLRWDTPRGNADDKISEGVHRGTRNSAHKLTDDQVREIWAHPFYRGYKNVLAKKYNVSTVLIKKIRSKLLWKHLL